LCVVDFVVVDGVYNIDGVVGCYCVGIISVAGHIDVTEHCIVVAGAVGMFVGCVATDVVGVVGVVCCGTFGDDVVIVAVSIYGVGGDVCVRVFGVYVNDCIFAVDVGYAVGIVVVVGGVVTWIASVGCCGYVDAVVYCLRWCCDL